MEYRRLYLADDPADTRSDEAYGGVGALTAMAAAQHNERTYRPDTWLDLLREQMYGRPSRPVAALTALAVATALTDVIADPANRATRPTLLRTRGEVGRGAVAPILAAVDQAVRQAVLAGPRA